MVAFGCTEPSQKASMQKNDLTATEKLVSSETAKEVMTSKLNLIGGKRNGSAYYEYDEASAQKALQDGKVVYLEFYASWCPTCRSMEPNIKEAFENADNPGIVGFRVNYDSAESLKKKYQISYQHTRVILKGDKVLIKSSESWNSDKILEELQKAAV